MLDSLHIKNFRCFEDLTIPSLGRVNLIVGKNNSGKSTVLEAIHVFASGGDSGIVWDLLTNRRDSYVNMGVDSLFFNGNEANIFESRLEIGDKENILIFFNQDSDKDGKWLDYVNDVLDLNLISGRYNIMYNIEGYSAFLFKKNQKSNRKIPLFYCPTFIQSESLLANIWDDIFLNNDDSVIKEVLKIIDDRIVNFGFVPVKKKDSEEIRLAVVKIKGASKALPIKSLGDGVGRMLQMILYALKAEKGFLLIDEFENGLHYSIQEEIWEKLFELAKVLDIQVFATTHSQDTLRAFGHVALRSPEEGKIISLARHTRDNDPKKGQISALVYDENDIEMILQTNMEVR